MAYKVLLHPKAARFLKKLDAQSKKPIKSKLKNLAKEPELGKPLKYSNFWRLRVGDYRAIYEIFEDKKQVVVLFVGHRKDVYDDFSKRLI